MSVIMYAIADRPRGAIEGVGLHGEPLRAICEGRLAAVVSDAERPSRGATEDELWAYESVVEQLMSRHAILPARFGSVFEEESEAHEMLRRRRDSLAAALNRVRGAVELAVRGCWPAAGAPGLDRPPPESGTAYMHERLELRRRAGQAAGRLAPLAELARAKVIRVLPHESVPVLAAYLVDRAGVQDFTRRVRRLDDPVEQVGLVCTGPWPPYSFVDGAAA